MPEKIFIDRDELLDKATGTDAYFQIKSIVSGISEIKVGKDSEILIEILKKAARDLEAPTPSEFADYLIANGVTVVLDASEELTDLDKKILLTYAATGMSLSATASRLHYSRSAIVYHMKRIREKKRLDPLDFYDLYELISGIDNKEELDLCST